MVAFGSKAQFANEYYYKDNFNSIYESSQGEFLSINIYYTNYNERKVEFIKINTYGEIYFRKETTDILPWYEYFWISQNDEIIFSTEVGFKKFNFNGDFLGTTIVTSAEMGPFIVDGEGNYILAQRLSSGGCKVIKLDSEGTVLWNHSIPTARYITPPIEIDGMYMVGVHTTIQQSDSIHFVKYGSNGEVMISKRYALNDDILELHKNSIGLYALSRNGRMISLNDHLDTLWTRKVANKIDESKGNEEGIYFYQFEGVPSGVQSVKMVNFSGDVIWEYIRYGAPNEYIRSVTLTKEDNILMVCSTYVDNNFTLLIEPLKKPVTGNRQAVTERLAIFPNPVEISEPLYVKSRITDGTLKIFDQFGHKVLDRLINPNDTEHFNFITKGIYFYQIEQKNTVIMSGKIVVN